MSEVRCLLLVDVADSTEVSGRLGDAAMAALWAVHDRVARDLLRTWRGREIDKSDGFLLLFANAEDAVGYALDYHRALSRLEVPLAARAGLHVGAVILRENSAADIALGAKPLEVEGVAKATAARVMSIAQAGQTLLTGDARNALGQARVRLHSHGHWSLKGVAEPIELFETGADDASFAAPPDAAKAFRVVRRDGRWLPARLIENNLPQQVNSFIGRERDLSELKELLVRTRMLTLLGPGGIGKTRLSQQLAAEVLYDYPDGVWFVELAPVTDARLVPQAVASALGTREDAGSPVIESLVAHLKARRSLLILDNCEHLLQACAELAESLLQAAGQLTILASSREPLHIAGETTHQVPTLTLPDAQSRFTADAIAHYEAARLFVERAAAGQPAFRLTDQSATAIATICRRLDGIPLAIELAAARVRALSVESISERLSDRFRLLVGGSRVALPRQQTLRALIDWSYELLSAQERVLLGRLSVFAGGWTLEAAEAVGADGADGEPQVLELLTHLVEKSLVQLDVNGERYRLLETVQHYARERLVESADSEATRTRHLAYFAAFAEKASPELWGAQQGLWVSRLDLERENLMLAHAWCDQAPDGATTGLKLVGAIQNYWSPAGLIKLGYRITVEALMRAGAQQRNADRCHALYAASQLAFFMGRFDAARAHGEESLAVAREIGNARRAADALLMLGYACDALGDRIAVREHFEESVALARRLGDRARLSFALNALAGYHDEDESDLTVPLYEESLALAREVQDRESVAVTAQNLARALIRRGSREPARGMLLEALEIALAIGSKAVLLYVLDTCTGFSVMQQDWPRAARIFGAAEAERERLALPRIPGDAALVAPLVEQARQRLGAEGFAQAQAAGRALDFEAVIAEMRRWLGDKP